METKERLWPEDSDLVGADSPYGRRLPRALDHGQSEAHLMRRLELRAGWFVRRYQCAIIAFADLVVANEVLSAARKAAAAPSTGQE